MYDILRVTCAFVYSSHVIFLVFVGCLWFCTVLYYICAFEFNIYVGMFEEIVEFSDLWTMVLKGCPFFVFIFTSHGTKQQFPGETHNKPAN